MSERLRIAVVGAGRVAQAVHLPLLGDLHERFDVVAVADADRGRAAAVARRFGVPGHAGSLDELLAGGPRPDAVVVASTAVTHPDVVATALGAGLHVLCEKPLAVGADDVRRLIAARDRADRVLQVGYMKRHDPSYRRLLGLLPADADDIVAITSEVTDPDWGMPTTHLAVIPPVDPPADLDTRMREAAEAAAGRPLDDHALRAYARTFQASLVHGVNLAHGILATVGHPVPATLVDAGMWAEGAAVDATWALATGARLRATHLSIPGVNHYRDRLAVHCRDRTLELRFASPYLYHRRARLIERRTAADGVGLATTEHRTTDECGFRAQLRAFHDAALGRRPVTLGPEDALVDVEALAAAHARADPRAAYVVS
jgi:predicted dehydrogenase